MYTEMSALTHSAATGGSPQTAASPVQSAQRPTQQRSASTGHPVGRLAGGQAALREAADEAAAAALSERTRALYAADWARFTGWCAQVGLCALPAAVDTI